MIIGLRSYPDTEDKPVTQFYIDLDQVVAWQFKYPEARVEGVQLLLSSGATLEFSVSDTDNPDLMDLVTALSQKARFQNKREGEE
jgi:hypothetical protein